MHYHAIYNWSGARSPAYVFNGAWTGSNQVGMYASDLFTWEDGHTYGVDVGSRLSWFSVMTEYYHSTSSQWSNVAVGGGSQSNRSVEYGLYYEDSSANSNTYTHRTLVSRSS